jgi:dienelactone hydrolase
MRVGEIRMKKMGWILIGIVAVALGAGERGSAGQQEVQQTQATQQTTQGQAAQQTQSGQQSQTPQQAKQPVLLTPPGQAQAAPAEQGADAPNIDWQAAGREVVEELASGKFAAIEAKYDENMQAALAPGKLAETWEPIAAQVGTFQKILDIKVSPNSGYQRVEVNCHFSKADLWVRIIFEPDGEIAGLRLVPEEQEEPWGAPAYADTKSFHEQPFTVVNGKFELPGTLTLPTGNGPFPVVVLVHGSGPNDADETLGPNKPFKDLAWGLASHGVAVLRYTKRTKQYGAAISADPNTFTVEDETDSDARAAVALLTKQPGVDPQRVYVLGHSLGGMLAPRIAAGDPQVAGIIILAGTTRPLEDVILDQLKYIKGLPGGDTARMYQQMNQAEAAKKQIEDPGLKAGTTVDVMGVKIPASYWLDLRTYDPAEAAAKLTIPMLVLQGGRDYQVTKPDFERYQKALAVHPNAALKWYPTMNHLFIEGSKASTPREYDSLGHVSEQVINDIAAWVAAQAKQ